MNKIIITLALITSLWTSSVLSVSLNPKGVGEVLIFPYYTVNNGFNTYYSIVNSTSDPKAIKVNFLEGENSVVVLSFNVYLDAYDVWTGVLTPITSTISGHVGEPSVMHTYNDNSCAPWLYSSQEFIAYWLDHDPFNNNLQRSTEGHFEVIEMGTLTGSAAIAAAHDASGTPSSCATLRTYWEGVGQWNPNTGGDPSIDIETTTGGLSGTATLLNVSSGYAVGYDAIALGHFFQGTVNHTLPGTPTPNLANAHPESSIIHNNQVITMSWPSGAEAVSALLQQQSIINQYNLDAALNAASEWVITYPTKYLHVNGSTPIPPFTNLWNSNTACEDISIDFWDSEEQHVPDTNLSSCYSVNVLEFLNDGQSSTGTSNIFGSDNLMSLTTSSNPYFKDQGWAEVNFAQSIHLMNNDGKFIVGLPAVGFAVEKFSNAGAPAGVLAQYANLYTHNTSKSIFDDLIFIDGFETSQSNPPSIDFFRINGASNDITINPGEVLNMTWSSSHTNSCAASSSPVTQGWDGSVGLNGATAVSVNVNTSFTLTCDQVSATINVVVQNSQTCSNNIWPPGLTKVEKTYHEVNDGFGFGETTHSNILENFSIHQFLALSNVSTNQQNFRRRLQFYQNPTNYNANWIVSVSLSECPGDFTNNAICNKTVFPQISPHILVSTNPTDDTDVYCVIEPNKTYYLNMVHDEDPYDSTPPRCQYQSNEDCAIFMNEVIVN